jgi:myo-inositol-1(or 4)-monophosphatase
VAGGIALALESGALVADRHGRTSAPFGDGLLVAAPGVADEVLRWWREAAAL